MFYTKKEKDKIVNAFNNVLKFEEAQQLLNKEVSDRMDNFSEKLKDILKGLDDVREAAEEIKKFKTRLDLINQQLTDLEVRVSVLTKEKE